MNALRGKPREYAVTAPAHDPRWMILVVLALPEAIAFVAILFALRSHVQVVPVLQPVRDFNARFSVPLAAVFAVVTALLWWAVQRRRVVFADGILDVTATLYRRKLDPAAFDLDQARIVDLDEHTQWRPFIKSNGVGLPGLRAGWYRSRGFARLFCLLTAQERVLVLPERKGGATLLSLERPQQLLDALRDAADATRGNG